MGVEFGGVGVECVCVVVGNRGVLGRYVARGGAFLCGATGQRVGFGSGGVFLAAKSYALYCVVESHCGWVCLGHHGVVGHGRCATGFGHDGGQLANGFV